MAKNNKLFLQIRNIFTKFCDHCGKEISRYAIHCPGCEKHQVEYCVCEETNSCTTCDNKIDIGAKYCTRCGVLQHTEQCNCGAACHPKYEYCVACGIKIQREKQSNNIELME